MAPETLATSEQTQPPSEDPTPPVPRPTIGRPLEIHVMTPVPPEEPSTASEPIPRPSIGRPLEIHVITPESPTTGGKTEPPSDRHTPSSDRPLVVTQEEPTTTDSSDEVDVELNIPGIGSIDVDVGADGVRVNGEVSSNVKNPTGKKLCSECCVVHVNKNLPELKSSSKIICAVW